MKGKHLAALAVLVVVLFGLRLLLTRRDREVAQDLAGAGVLRLLPQSLEAKDVRWIRVSAPAEATVSTPAAATSAPAPPPEPKALRAARGSGTEWVLPSAQDAPADGSAVNAFVESALALSGEERGEGATHYPEFGLDAAHAVKVELGTTDPEKAAATFWLGKTGDSYDAHFVRVEGSERVSHVSQGVRAALGLSGDNARPDPDHWLEKNLLKVDEASVKSLTIERPDVRYVFEHAPAAVVTAPATDASAPPPAPPAREWKVIAPTAVPWPARKDSLAGTLGRVGSVRIDSVAPPDACSGASPVSKVTIAEDGGATHEVTLGAKLASKDDTALRVAGDPHCYGLASHATTTLLPRASALFDVPAVFKDPPASSAVKQVTYARRGTTIHLAQREEGKWTLEAPEKGTAEASRISRLVGAVTGLRIDDLAEASKVPAESLKAEATITLDAGAKSLTVILLGKRLGGIGEERYVRIKGEGAPPAGFVGVIADYAAESLLLSLKDLLPAS